jgi:hypothetical protein
VVPVDAGLHREREHLTAFEILEQAIGSLQAEEGVAECSGEPPEDARSDQEFPRALREFVEDVVGEVLTDQTGAATQGRQRLPPGGRWLPPGGEEEELQSGGPTLGAARQFGQILRRKRLGVEIPEEPLHFPHPEAQILGTEFEEIARHPQPREVEARSGAGGEDHAQPRRCVLNEPSEQVLGRCALQIVKIVDDEDGPGVGSVVERHDEVVDAGGPERKVRQRHGERLLEPAQEGVGASIAGIGPVPRDRGRYRRGEPGDKGGLP